MVTKRGKILALVLVLLLGLLLSPALAQRGRSGRGSGRSGGRGFSRGRSHSGSRISHRRGFSRRSSIGHHKGSRRSSNVGRHSGVHHRSSIGHHKGSRRSSNVGHHSGVHHRSSIGRHKGLHLRSHSGHHKGSHHGFRHSRRGHHGYHGSHLFYYFSLPYRTYYYPYYYRYPSYYDSQPYREDEYSSSQQRTEEEPYYDRFSDVREKVKAQEAKQTAQKERVNKYLDSVAEAFAAGDYAEAALRASNAVKTEPDDAVLPFVYTQSLFADGQYVRAATVLRKALSNIDPDSRQVYYPLGLYPDKNVLTGQIEMLTNAVQTEPENTDLQLLLGYELLGADRLEEALHALQKAQNDYVNRDAAATLMEVLEKTPAQDSEYAPVQKPSKPVRRDYY